MSKAAERELETVFGETPLNIYQDFFVVDCLTSLITYGSTLCY